jgi:hypothetical protein
MKSSFARRLLHGGLALVTAAVLPADFMSVAAPHLHPHLLFALCKSGAQSLCLTWFFVVSPVDVQSGMVQCGNRPRGAWHGLGHHEIIAVRSLASDDRYVQLRGVRSMLGALHERLFSFV